MSDYRRLISYIYEYEGKEKGKNVGFVKLESKNGQCRMNLSVKKVYVGGNAIGVYLLNKNGGEAFLGNIFIRNGNGEFRATVDARNVEGSGNGLDTYYGLTVHDVKNAWRSYTTIWEDAVAPVMQVAEAKDVLPGIGEIKTSQAVSKVVKEIEEEIAREEELTRAAEVGAAAELPVLTEAKGPVCLAEPQAPRVLPDEPSVPEKPRQAEEARVSEAAQGSLIAGVFAPAPEQLGPAPGEDQSPQAVEDPAPMSGQPAPAAIEGPEPRSRQPVPAAGEIRPALEQPRPQTREAQAQPPMQVIRRIINNMAQPAAPAGGMPQKSQPTSRPPVTAAAPQSPPAMQPSADTLQSAPSAGMPDSAREATAANRPREEAAMRSPELENPEVLKYLQETEDLSADPEKLWQELRKSYPKIQPFDHESGCEILTIRPQDIGRLPRESWIYGNNSFLLHGYYNFRYIILVRLGGKNGSPRYLIGVPGHYYSNEKYMASMFGFPNFVLSKKQPPNDGRFGYWYTDIKIR